MFYNTYRCRLNGAKIIKRKAIGRYLWLMWLIRAKSVAETLPEAGCGDEKSGLKSCAMPEVSLTLQCQNETWHQGQWQHCLISGNKSRNPNHEGKSRIGNDNRHWPLSLETNAWKLDWPYLIPTEHTPWTWPMKNSSRNHCTLCEKNGK